MNKPASVDDYINAAPPEIRNKLRRLRRTIQDIAPDATEKISYGIPYYDLNGRLVYFAHFKNHINLTIMLSGVQNFKNDLAGYVTGKGSVQFPLDKPLPLPLIKKIVTLRAHEQRAKK